MADIIGIEQLIKHIAPLNVVSISFFSKPKDKNPFYVAHREHGDLLEQLKDYCIQQEAAGNQYIARQMRISHETGDGKIYQQIPTFAVMAKEKQLQVNGPPAPAAPDAGLMAIYVELGYLRAEVARLRQENKELTETIDEYEAMQPDEIGEISATDKAKQYIELFNQAAPIIGALFGSKQMPANHAVNGTAGTLSISEIVNELQTLDADLIVNLSKLLQLAKNKPEIYKMAVAQIDNFL